MCNSIVHFQIPDIPAIQQEAEVMRENDAVLQQGELCIPKNKQELYFEEVIYNVLDFFYRCTLNSGKEL